ncbi:hypothetical protein KP78_09950 [Jeotgalibacillus soli]|uniref:FlgN protein n=1 Tax=Jeotgalibacillus soli TaxID=889306 RepID=A0A0C2VKY2_9BACL|nr:hypothetical protein KP78_09950 [Jeotgalibacillus soli]
MKLAEALLERADLQKRLAQMDDRLMRSAIFQEGNEPPEDPTELLIEMKRLFEKLEKLFAKNQKMNATSELAPYRMLSDALAKRDLLMQKRQKLQTLVENASGVENRYSLFEIRNISTVNVRAL